MSTEQAILRAVEVREPERRTFCGYCAHRPEGAADAEGAASRVCSECGLGLLLTADEGLAPGRDEAFVVVDPGLNVQALSKRAEKLFDLAETDVVDQPVENVLVAADSSDDARGKLHALLSGAARAPLAGGDPAVAIVRPARAFGVRYRARVGRCEPGRAALLVLSTL